MRNEKEPSLGFQKAFVLSGRKERWGFHHNFSLRPPPSFIEHANATTVCEHDKNVKRFSCPKIFAPLHQLCIAFLQASCYERKIDACLFKLPFISYWGPKHDVSWENFECYTLCADTMQPSISYGQDFHSQITWWTMVLIHRLMVLPAICCYWKKETGFQQSRGGKRRQLLLVSLVLRPNLVAILWPCVLSLSSWYIPTVKCRG